jgi:hypothetical protein
MNKNILPLGVLAVVIAFGGAFLAVSRVTLTPQMSGRVGGMPGSGAARPSPARPAAEPPAAGNIVRDETPAVPRQISVATLEHRDAAEVFPNCVPPADDWRHRHPASLRVAPYPRKAVTFQQVRVKEDGRYLTWIGRNPDLPGATYVGIATPDGYDAVMIVPGAGQYHFHVRAGLALVEETNATGGDCESGPPVATMASLPVPAGVHYAAAGGSAAGGTAELTAAPRSADTPPNVDVLFLYNTRALAVAAQRSSDPIGYMDGYTRAGLETCNLVLQNSRVDTFVWRYVGLVALPSEYPQQVTVSDDLGMIGPGGQFDDFVRSVRAQYGADQVLMWTGAGTRQGAAYAGDVRSEAVPPEYAVAALRLTAGILILGHELAHNFGCQHDRGHAGTGDGSTATPEGDGLWCYGLMWNDPVGGTTSGTVMAYADFLVPYFSNPDITLDITSTLENRAGAFLNLGTRTIGFSETDPRAANNARILQEHGAYMAALSPETEAVPVLLQQPDDAAVAAGQVMTLNVSAMGGGLSYQWFKDATAIDGATAATYGKTFAAADGGGYSVRVSNRQGAVTSRTAAITLIATPPTVAAPAPVVPTAPPAGGGGGGGGAPSGWFYLSLLVMLLLRLGRRPQAG